MSQSGLVSDWVNRFTDPFSLLGVSVTADDRRVQKRYRSVAMRLHPDRFVDADEATKDLTGKLLARLVNPAYEKLQQEKGRKEHLALLRLKVRKLTREASLAPKSEIARQLMERPVSDVDMFYEQAIAKLADAQLEQYDQFGSATEQLLELNLVYLQLKMGDSGIQEKRTGLVAASEAKPIQFTPAPANPDVAAESYDQRHYRRAQEYAKKGSWSQVVEELKDAIKIRADKSEYHSLLGIAYLKLEKPLEGMARVHIKRAYALNPNDPYALRFGPKLGLEIKPIPNQQNGKHHSNGTKESQKESQKPIKRGGLFGLFGGKK